MMIYRLNDVCNPIITRIDILAISWLHIGRWDVRSCMVVVARRKERAARVQVVLILVVSTRGATAAHAASTSWFILVYGSYR